MEEILMSVSNLETDSILALTLIWSMKGNDAKKFDNAPKTPKIFSRIPNISILSYGEKILNKISWIWK